MKTLNNNDFVGMLKSAYANLYNNEKKINSINIFPIPDNDAGSNMLSTFSSGLNEVINNDDKSLTNSLNNFVKGLSIGAKGSSGIILSQIFKGFYLQVDDKELLDVNDIALAFRNAAIFAYKVTIKPIEGTIFTLINESTNNAYNELNRGDNDDIITYFERLVFYANESLKNSTSLLPILKQVNVVDSGAKGLLCILEGFLAYLKGKPYIIKKK